MLASLWLTGIEYNLTENAKGWFGLRPGGSSCCWVRDERSGPADKNEFQQAPRIIESSTVVNGRVTVIWFQCWPGQEDVDVCCLSVVPSSTGREKTKCSSAQAVAMAGRPAQTCSTSRRFNSFLVASQR
jgi:hypothetical protein